MVSGHAGTKMPGMPRGRTRGRAAGHRDAGSLPVWDNWKATLSVWQFLHLGHSRALLVVCFVVLLGRGAGVPKRSLPSTIHGRVAIAACLGSVAITFMSLYSSLEGTSWNPPRTPYRSPLKELLNCRSLVKEPFKGTQKGKLRAPRHGA